MDLSDWPNAAETARALSMSERTLRRLGDRGPESKLRTREGRKPERVYNPQDVAVLVAAANPPKVLPALIDEQSPGNSLLKAEPPIDKVLAVIEGLSRIANHNSPPEPKLFLNLDEAATLSGLSESFLRRAIVAGELVAIRDRGIKILRSELEQFCWMLGSQSARQSGQSGHVSGLTESKKQARLNVC